MFRYEEEGGFGEEEEDETSYYPPQTRRAILYSIKVLDLDLNLEKW